MRRQDQVRLDQTCPLAASALGEGEEVRNCAGVPVLRYLRAGPNPALPLVVFLPGGGHLARVVYGHPKARRMDFLDHWLEQDGFGLLAFSYPCGPPIMPEARADLTLTTWAEAAAEATRDAVDATGGTGSLIVIAWSMGGRVVDRFAAEAEARGLAIEAFMPMAASPPLAGLSSTNQATERFLDNGLWDVHGSPINVAPRRQAWLQDLAAIDQRHGRVVLSPEEYSIHYCVGTPIGLRFDRPSDPTETDLGLAAFPLSAPMVPTDSADYRHSLTDGAVWGVVNAQVILRRWVDPAMAAQGAIAPDTWTRLRSLMTELPQRLIRHVAGGHHFFIGEQGARATARAIVELRAASGSVTAELDLLLAPPTRPDGGPLAVRTHPPRARARRPLRQLYRS